MIVDEHGYAPTGMMRWVEVRYSTASSRYDTLPIENHSGHKHVLQQAWHKAGEQLQWRDVPVIEP